MLADCCKAVQRLGSKPDLGASHLAIMLLQMRHWFELSLMAGGPYVCFDAPTRIARTNRSGFPQTKTAICVGAPGAMCIILLRRKGPGSLALELDERHRIAAYQPHDD
jgi:hypothetical protein